MADCRLKRLMKCDYSTLCLMQMVAINSKIICGLFLDLASMGVVDSCQHGPGRI
jgi:hypothetical protein